MYGRSDVNVKVERSSTFTFTRGFSYIVSILFTHVKPVKVYVRTHVKITRQWKSTFCLKYAKTYTRSAGYYLRVNSSLASPPPLTSRNLQRYSMDCHHTIYETCFTINKTFISILDVLLPLNDLTQYQ